MVQHSAQLQWQAFEPDMVGFDLGQLQDVVDHAQQVLARLFNLVELGQLAAVLDAAPQQVGEADDGIHRRADLVAHVGQKAALGQAGRIGTDLGVAQFQFHGLARREVGTGADCA